MIWANPRLLAPAGLYHHRAPLLAHVEYLIARAADLRARQQALNFEDKLPAKLVGLERADGAQLAITFAPSQLEAGAEHDRMSALRHREEAGDRRG